ncbi:MAG: hypothetical protein A2945_02700 [Candidatus Liptonbacteria bacterium RIFCSPLOWO2_01_FULL_52_25]|uniref:Transketolase N-terminal domain-containing protein n=1 Tax=Candidatus Liptonbacteria bacterium RIFCSPLOWO2_01_FULL_52_25 TaxID=1798650 RepID=A0A1G2CEP9_9BACT|nr:MAG: hypothetical protein A2945_02700 [Candidatus Liptonbacteria bacterium RIFCSPLOWO2_01_FULL_52_25]
MSNFNTEIRKTILRIIHESHAAHTGTSLSAVEILIAVFKSMDLEKIKKHNNARDRIILSKGHGTAALYAVMYHFGLLTEDEINTYFKNGTVLAGHTSHHVPFVEHSTGALGHGLPVALGIALGLRSLKLGGRSFVVTGDGELHEGSNWEAIMLAGHMKMQNLCLLVDKNGLSQVGRVDECCTVDPLKEKFESFNFAAYEVDGHDDNKIQEIIQKTENSEKPVAIVCHTVKGKGISFMEHNNEWHYMGPQGEDYEKVVEELENASS